MSLVMARVSMRRAVGTKLFVAVAGFGIATVVFALSRNIALSVAALVFRRRRRQCQCRDPQLPGAVG